MKENLAWKYQRWWLYVTGLHEITCTCDQMSPKWTSQEGGKRSQAQWCSCSEVICKQIIVRLVQIIVRPLSELQIKLELVYVSKAARRWMSKYSFRRSYQYGLNTVFPFVLRKAFRKSSNQKIYIAQFGPLNMDFSSWKWYKRVFLGYVFRPIAMLNVECISWEIGSYNI